jgi:phosphate-selective porin OprO and OprP
MARPDRSARRTLGACIFLAALLGAHGAGAQTNAELMRIIQEQQRQIEELSRKVDALTGQAGAATQKADQAEEQAAAAVETAQKAEEAAPDFEVKWAPGPTFASKDGSWSVHVRGRLFVDGGALGDDDDLYKNDNAAELRAARLGIEGGFLQGWRYRLEADFADSDVDVKDAYIQYGGEVIDPAWIRAGQFKTPNSLEELTSARFTTFMERAAITDAFALDRQIGLGGGVGGENWGVDAGLFGQDAENVNDNEGYAIAGRGHYAFFPGPEGRDENGSHAIHVGASARYRNFDNDTFNSEVRYRQRPFFHFTGTRSVDTGAIPDAEGDVWAGAEFAWVDGPFSLQSEVANTFLQRKHGQEDANNLWGGYLSASYFLTGEHRNYDPEGGTFERVQVIDPLHKGGLGAWEVAGRADYIDLNNEGVKGGEQISYIAGVNWYANDYVRFMLDRAVTQVFAPAVRPETMRRCATTARTQPPTLQARPDRRRLAAIAVAPC